MIPHMGTSNYRKTSLFPKTLAQCIEPVTRPALKTQGLAGSRILTQWASIVGPKLAQHTIPEKLTFPPAKKTNGTLVIAVENGFAPEIQHMQPVIMERLAGYFGYHAVSRIVISHTYLPNHSKTPVGASPKKTQHTIAGDISQHTKDIADDELRETLQSLARTLSGTPT
jgi:hypothetical protein